MAYWAEINKNLIVIRVLGRVDIDANLDNEYQSLVEEFGGVWIQASNQKSVIKKYAQPGYSYNETLDAFITPKPYPSWILNEDSVQWYAPADRPTDGKFYEWDEDTLSWI